MQTLQSMHQAELSNAQSRTLYSHLGGTLHHHSQKHCQITGQGTETYNSKVDQLYVTKSLSVLSPLALVSTFEQVSAKYIEVIYLRFFLDIYIYICRYLCFNTWEIYMFSITTALNHEFYKLSTWLKANKLSLNNAKTYYILFQRARIKLPDIEYLIIMNNSLLSNIKHHKYLGVILDSKISWIQHYCLHKEQSSQINWYYVCGKNLSC